MNEDILVMLDDEMKTIIEGLKPLTPSSKEYSDAVDNLAKLYKLRIEDSKAAMEYNKEIDNDQFRKDQLEKEEQSRKEQLVEQRIDRVVRIVLVGFEIMVPIIFYNSWLNRGIEFEKTGAFTSLTVRNLINRFRPTAK